MSTFVLPDLDGEPRQWRQEVGAPLSTRVLKPDGETAIPPTFLPALLPMNIPLLCHPQEYLSHSPSLAQLPTLTTTTKMHMIAVAKLSKHTNPVTRNRTASHKLGLMATGCLLVSAAAVESE